ncbi:aldo/keto reductase [Alteromonas sp. 14N.309.X.WAT.G.H12]|uniref:aldo/keto reductase n=1 Tax=Alteromonas sp. 14N.309.X.WAT.G.H12 TaxID=3120824 RepID=UPI002FD29BDE
MAKGMTKNTIGQTALAVSELGFGGASVGNLYKAISDEQAQQTIQAAIAAGITLFDTAPHYGLGLSERRIGDALRALPAQDYVLSTKVGRVLTADPTAKVDEIRYGFATPMPFDAHYDYSYDGIMRSYFDSLQRIGVAKIDVLLVHDLGAITHKEQDAFYYEQFCQSGYKAIDELRQQGLVSAVGLGVNETAICERVMEIGQFDCFLLAGRYSLLEQEALTSFLPKCAAHGASIILGGPYNSGILATGVNTSHTPLYNYAPAPEAIVQRVAKIETICRQFEVTLAAAALQFPLAHPCVASVIPGLGSAAIVAQTTTLLEQTIPAEFWQTLHQHGLLDPLAPVPMEGG